MTSDACAHVYIGRQSTTTSRQAVSSRDALLVKCRQMQIRYDSSAFVSACYCQSMPLQATDRS